MKTPLIERRQKERASCLSGRAQAKVAHHVAMYDSVTFFEGETTGQRDLGIAAFFAPAFKTWGKLRFHALAADKRSAHSEPGLEINALQKNDPDPF
jgi:hypothetical protein